MAILVSDKVDLWAENITSDKESNFIMIKGSIHQEDTAILNTYELNNKIAVQANTEISTEKRGAAVINT